MKSFLDPKIEAILADKSDTQRIQAIAFSIACLLNGPTAFQPPDFYHIPKRSVSKESDEEKTKDDESKDAKEQENEEAWFGQRSEFSQGRDYLLLYRM